MFSRSLQGGLRLGAVEVDEAFFGGRIKRGKDRRKNPVSGIKFRDGNIKVARVEKVNARTITKFLLKHVAIGSTVYSDSFKVDHHLSKIGYDHKMLNHKICFARGDVHKNGIEGVWSHIRGNLIRYKAISKKHFHLYLAEQELRFKSRSDLFENLVTSMMEFVPRN